MQKRAAAALLGLAAAVLGFAAEYSNSDGRDYDVVCSGFTDGIFVSASIAAAIGVACAIAAYVDIMRHRDRTARRPRWASPWGSNTRLNLRTVAAAPSNLEGRQLEPHDVGIPPACACGCLSVAMLLICGDVPPLRHD
ncbi:hypothetical protein SETIT_1G227200v2 [Setaria italica]|uniref:CASP-like protein n=1 Tax=Setaria italica TaxID=4555 RepID=A0A368PN63_SETIT|nr:hypothetical protein SETIT_1G227200v2 [Setaria italica]